MRALFAAVVAGVCAVCMVCVQPALATVSPGPGVHIDPGSPAGKQYQIPIVGARDETSGGSHSSASGSAPTFGTGVTPSASSGSSSAAQATATTATRSRHGTRTRKAVVVRTTTRHKRTAAHSGASAPVTTANAADRSATAQANQVGSSSWLPLAGGGALVLLIGCGGGLALKRRS